jgi:tetratricopeptide (TPR) repeat protein
VHAREHRFQSMAELADALLACMHKLGLSTEPPVLADAAAVASSQAPSAGAHRTRAGVSSPRVTPPLAAGGLPRTEEFVPTLSSARRFRAWPAVAAGSALAAAAAVAIVLSMEPIRPPPRPVTPAPAPPPSPPVSSTPAPAEPQPTSSAAPKGGTTASPPAQPEGRESRRARAAHRLIAEAAQLLAAKRLDEAIDKFNEALDKAPEAASAQAFRGLAIAYDRAGDRKQALKYYLLYKPYCPTAERDSLEAEIAKLSM